MDYAVTAHQAATGYLQGGKPLGCDSLVQRRRAPAMNQSYIAVVQLRLRYSSRQEASEAGQVGNLSRYEMAPYIMKRLGIAANLRPAVLQPCAQA